MYEARRWRDDPRFFAPTVTVGSHHYFVGDLVMVATDEENTVCLAKIVRFLEMVSIVFITLHHVMRLASIGLWYNLFTINCFVWQKADGSLMAEVHKLEKAEDVYTLDAQTGLVPTSSILCPAQCPSREGVMIKKMSNSQPQHLSDDVCVRIDSRRYYNSFLYLMHRNGSTWPAHTSSRKFLGGCQWWCCLLYSTRTTPVGTGPESGISLICGVWSSLVFLGRITHSYITSTFLLAPTKYQQWS